MRYLLIIILSVVSFTACAQIRARQIRVDSNFADLQVVVNDTVSGSTQYKLGKWFNVYDLITSYLDSLGIVYPSDTDWLKYGSTDIPDNDDTIYHLGPVFIGPGPTEFTGDGLLNARGRFDLSNGGTSIFIGGNSGNLGAFNIGIGQDVLSNGSSNISTRNNVGIGYQALEYNTTGRDNMAIGYLSLNDNTTGSRNTAVGSAALVGNTTGNRNVSIGNFSMNANSTGSGNVGIGAYSLFNTTGSKNVAIGDSVAYNETGSNLLYIDNSNTSSPLIKGDFAADTLHVFGKLGYSTDAGNPDVLTGLDGRQFTSVYLGYGLDFSNDTLNVDTTEVGGGTGGGGGTNLSIDGGGPEYLIASSTGNDVVIDSDITINLSEPGTDTLRFKVDTTVMATQYDLSQLDEDDDWYVIGTTDAPQAITDTMFHTGITGIGESTAANMLGALTIGSEQGGTTGLAINGFSDTGVPFGLYQAGDPANGWQFRTSDADDFWIEQVIAGSEQEVFFIDYGTPSGTLNLQADGEVQIGDYPNTRDDGTAANFLGTSATGEIRSYDIDDVISEWYLEATGTPGTETITDGETVTFSAAGAATVARSGSTITYTVTEGDGSTTNEAWTIDATSGDTELINSQTVLFQGSGIASTSYSAAANTLTITATEVDGSTTNELQTVQENDVTVTGGTGISTLDFGTLFDLTAGSGEANINLDLGEAATVTTAQTDDYVLLYDNGSAIEEKILATDLISDPITVYDNGSLAGTGFGLDFGLGFSAAEVADVFDINLSFGELAIDAATEGDEYVILYDPSSVTNERTLISSFGSDGNGIYDGSGTVPTNTTATLTDGTFKFTGSTAHVKIEDTGTDAALLLAGNIGNSDARMGYISFQYTDSGYATDASAMRIEANRENDDEEYYTLQFTSGTEDILTLESNESLSDNTSEKAAFIHGGVAKTEYWSSSGANAVTLDRGYYNVALHSGHTGTITLPEISGLAENYLEVASTQVPVGQEYVITNISGSAVTIAVVNNTGTLNDDWIGSTSSAFAEAGTYSLATGKSVIVKAVTTLSNEGYWFVNE